MILYGKDRITPAKKAAMALSELITTKFSKEALGASSKKGAVPVVLIDGSTLIDIMIEKKFGIDIQNLPIYINALDEVLTVD
jgi:restriction system protein